MRMLFLVCKDHEPNLQNKENSGSDIEEIKKDILKRNELIAAAEIDCWPNDECRVNSVKFFQDHPKCKLWLTDEFGRLYHCQQ